MSQTAHLIFGINVHKLTEINEQTRKAICAECGPVTIKPRYNNKNTFRCKKSWKKNSKKYHKYKKPYSKYKKDYCESCGFVAEHLVQLDVDHIDGNHNNNDINNLQTLCSNCHRLKTYVNKDHIKQKKAPTQDLS